MINVTKSVHNNILAGSLKTGSTHTTVIALYGLQESEQAVNRSEFFEEAAIEIQACEDRGSEPILIGDLNAKIAMNTDGLISTSPQMVRS